MSKRINELIKAETAQASQVIQQAAEADKLATEQVDAILLLGGIDAVGKVSAVLGAQSFRALQNFRDRKGYIALGYERFDDFLDKWPRSPMSKNEFYRRQTLLENEGDAAFEFLNGLGISLQARRALKKGEVAVEGDKVIVGDQEIAIHDTHQIKNVVKLLADKAAEQQRTIQRGKDEIKVLKKRIDETPASTDGPRATMDFDSLASQAYLQALSALNDLESALKQLPAPQRQAQIKELQPGLELAFQNWTLFANGFKDKATGAPADDELEKIFEAEISNAAFED